MQSDLKFTDERIPTIYVSLYIDGTQLAECGSLNCTVLRFRVDNIAGASEIWTEFGIAPGYVGDEQCVKGKDLVDLRLQLFQRYLFLVFESTSNHSKQHSEKCKFEVRLLSMIIDQKQEIYNYCLYQGTGLRDCSICRLCTADERERLCELSIKYQQKDHSRISSHDKGNVHEELRYLLENEALRSECEYEGRIVLETVCPQLEKAIIDIFGPYTDCNETLMRLRPRWRRLLQSSKNYLKRRKQQLDLYLQQESAKPFPRPFVFYLVLALHHTGCTTL